MLLEIKDNCQQLIGFRLIGTLTSTWKDIATYTNQVDISSKILSQFKQLKLLQFNKIIFQKFKNKKYCSAKRLESREINSGRPKNRELELLWKISCSAGSFFCGRTRTNFLQDLLQMSIWESSWSSCSVISQHSQTKQKLIELN